MCIRDRSGVVFSSQTDTEVLGHLIAYHRYGTRHETNGAHGGTLIPSGPPPATEAPIESKPATPKLSLLEAVLATLAEVVGTFGMVCLLYTSRCV